MSKQIKKLAALWGLPAALFILMAAMPENVLAAQVLFVDSSVKPSLSAQQMEFACHFYGLRFDRISMEEAGSGLVIMETLAHSDAEALVLEAGVLARLDVRRVIATLGKKRMTKLLVMGLTSTTDSLSLHRWSGGAVTSCGYFSKDFSEAVCSVSAIESIARELAGQSLSLPITAYEGIHYLNFHHVDRVDIILQCTNSAKDLALPIFAKTELDGREIFISSKLEARTPLENFRWHFRDKHFVEIASAMMFLRYVFNNRCWHRANDFANFCIDDPWLTEPYGHLSYRGLLKEMQKVNFHTTIAFIAWNFDRSDPDVVSLIKQNPDRFSIAIHGNNHDHREFNSAKSLSLQQADIRQALARMGKFASITGLDYDRVMIFPHGIAPERTLSLLKKYDFLATVNGVNIPLGSATPVAAEYPFRSELVEYENFLSLKRYPPNRPASEMAIDLFLDNPALFYTHQDFFSKGMDAFNQVAETVNRLQPLVEWRNLGEITERLYLQKLRDDGNYDVLFFCSRLFLENEESRDVAYFIRKEESFSPAIKNLTVNGAAYAYDRIDKNLILQVTLPPNMSASISIEYENDLNLTAIDVSKKDMRIALLRKLSDFRDMTLSTNALGLAFVDFYYESGLQGLGLVNLAILLLVIFAVALWCGKKIRKRARDYRLLNFIQRR